MEPITIYNGEEPITLEVQRVNKLTQYSGLMFRTKETKPLLFEFVYEANIQIHSWFVFFPFIIIWLNPYNEVMGMQVVKPFERVRFTRPFKAFIEIPIK